MLTEDPAIDRRALAGLLVEYRIEARRIEFLSPAVEKKGGGFTCLIAGAPLVVQPGWTGRRTTL